MLSTRNTINTEECVGEDAYFQFKFKELPLQSNFSYKEETIDNVPKLHTNELELSKNIIKSNHFNKIDKFENLPRIPEDNLESRISNKNLSSNLNYKLKSTIDLNQTKAENFIFTNQIINESIIAENKNN